MASDADAMSPSELSKRKKSFLFEEEDIVMKPSTELISDEYEHGTSISLHIFRTKFDINLDDDFQSTLQDVNYKVNYHQLTTRKQFEVDLNLISKDAVDKEGLILIFLGFFEQDGCLFMIDEEDPLNKNINIKSVWNWFSAKECPPLKYKPKVFIFCTSKRPPSRVQTDSKIHKAVNFDKVYDVPAESDMLIIYKKIDDDSLDVKLDFMARFCANIRNYSKKHDIIDLITFSQAAKDKSIPLIISTFTSKFYLAPNDERNHYLSITENHKDLETTLREIQDNIHQWHDTPSKKKKYLSFGKTFSFKKKAEEKPKVEKVKPKEKPKISKTVPDSSAPSPSGSRSRAQSESEPKARISISDKPKWRN